MKTFIGVAITNDAAWEAVISSTDCCISEESIFAAITKFTISVVYTLKTYYTFACAVSITWTLLRATFTCKSSQTLVTCEMKNTCILRIHFDPL